MAKKIIEKTSKTDSYVSAALGLAVVLLIGSVIFSLLTKKSAPVTTPEAAKTEADQVQNQPLPTTHVVKANESLWSIAEIYYKSGYNWVNLREANHLTHPDKIDVGQILTIPNVKPIMPPGEISAASTTSKPRDASYTVKTGDTLWSIAQNEYENGYRWVDIARTNNLANPDVIHAGNLLKLP
jgi:nucleoid-associated protein YgaU